MVNRSSKLWVIVGVVLAIVIAAGVWLGIPGYRHFKERRALNEAKAFAEKGDIRSAVLSLRTALALNSSNLTAVRLMSELAEQAQSPEALAWRRRVVELEPTFENKLKFVSSALRSEKTPFPITDQALRELAGVGKTNAEYHAIASDLALKLNRMTEADQHLKVATALDPTNRLYQLNLATLEMRSADTNISTAARAALRTLASDTTVGAAALRSLAADAVVRKEHGEAEGYARQLMALSRPTFDDRLLNLTVLEQGQSEKLKKSVVEVQQISETNAVNVAQLTAWMNNHGLAKEALDWLNTLPPAIHNTLPVPLMEANCYLTVQDWPGLESRLSGMNWEDQEFMRQALLANSLRNQGRKQVADVVWKQAITAASSRGDYVGMLYELANSWGWQEETEPLLWALVKRNPRENWPLQTLSHRYEESGNTAGLLRVYEALLERYPKSNPAKNNVAAIALLLQRDVDRAATMAQEVYEAEKTNSVFLSTYAYSLHAKGKSDEALKLLQTLSDADLRRPEIATYYAVVLTATGDRAKAQTYVTAAEKARILPEERRLLDEIRIKN